MSEATLEKDGIEVWHPVWGQLELAFMYHAQVKFCAGSPQTHWYPGDSPEIEVKRDWFTGLQVDPPSPYGREWLEEKARAWVEAHWDEIEREWWKLNDSRIEAAHDQYVDWMIDQRRGSR